MAGKDNVRCMRLSDDVVKLIESQPGDSFTAKFEYLIYRCVAELPEKERALQFTRELIHEEDQRLFRIRKKASDLDSALTRMVSSLQYFNSQAKSATHIVEALIVDDFKEK